MNKHNQFVLIKDHRNFMDWQFNEDAKVEDTDMSLDQALRQVFSI